MTYVDERGFRFDLILILQMFTHSHCDTAHVSKVWRVVDKISSLSKSFRGNSTQFSNSNSNPKKGNWVIMSVGLLIEIEPVSEYFERPGKNARSRHVIGNSWQATDECGGRYE